MRFLYIAAALVLIGAAPASNKFDLACSGTTETDAGATEPYAEHYRLDLASRRWCMAECRVVKPFADVQASMFVLEQSTPPDTTFQHFIDREKGEDLIFDHSSGGGLRNTKGECKRLPFSGFPTFKTKF